MPPDPFPRSSPRRRSIGRRAGVDPSAAAAAGHRRRCRRLGPNAPRRTMPRPLLAMEVTTTNRPAPTAPRTTRRRSKRAGGCSYQARVRLSGHRGRHSREALAAAAATEWTHLVVAEVAAAAAAAAAASRTWNLLPLLRSPLPAVAPAGRTPFATERRSPPRRIPAASVGFEGETHRTVSLTTLRMALLAFVLRTGTAWDSWRTPGRRAPRTRYRRRRRRRYWRVPAGAVAASRGWRSG